MREDNMFKVGGILFAITFTVALILAIANMGTAERIKALNEKAQNDARAAVLSSASEFTPLIKEMDDENYKNVKSVYEGKNDSNVVGYCIQVAPTGFGGPIDMIVGIDKDGSITGVKITNMQETPGLGAKAKNEDFRNQYNGKSIDKQLAVIKNGTPKDNEITAISGATISSKAVTQGVNTAIKVFNEKINGGVKK